MKKSLFFLSLLIVFSSACSAAEDPLAAPGRCSFNTECGQGQTCKNTRCEDIYFPRRDIKPY